MEELSEIHKKGNTILMVTHNPNLTTYATRVITMLDGKIDTDTAEPRLEEKKPTKRPLSKSAKSRKKPTKRKAKK
jgi:ABC-type lipoprotein export system ATPase subunit